jgi:hypothetical protein
MVTRPPFLPAVCGVLLVPLVIWFVVTPAITEDASPRSRCLAMPAAPQPDTALSVGNYTLTLVTTSGLKAGSEATGSLWLARTSPADQSPRTGRRPASSSRRGVPFYGAVDLDFASVGAPVFRDDTLVPPPESRDPVRPGVVVLMQNWGIDTLPRRLVLVIGSLTNRRDDEGWLDGPGIALLVRSTNGQAFFGTWSEWGIIRGGQGHFCTRHVGP